MEGRTGNNRRKKARSYSTIFNVKKQKIQRDTEEYPDVFRIIRNQKKKNQKKKKKNQKSEEEGAYHSFTDVNEIFEL